MAAFREEFSKSKHIVVLTGAGVSAESGVPTFRGAGGLWRKFRAQVLIVDKLLAICSFCFVFIIHNIMVRPPIFFSRKDLATPESFRDNPSLVWEFYHYRREVMASKNPNPVRLLSKC